MVVVAIVVTIYTAGAAGSAVAAAASTAGTTTAAAATTTAAVAATSAAATTGAMATGAAVLSGGLGGTALFVGATAGAFAGSVASQAVGSAMGVASFSWRNVAASTVAAAATAGFSSMMSGVASPLVGAMATAAVGNVSNYAANKLVGNEASFSWKSVAASAVAAGITQQLAPTVARSIGVDSTQNGQAIVSGITGGIVSAHVRQGIVGGAIDYQDVFVDAFGNAVNGALMQRGQAALATRSQNTQAFSDEPTYLLASNGGGGGVGMALPEEFWPLASGSGDVRSNAINVAGTQESQAIPTMDTVYAVPDKYSPHGWYFYSWNPAGQQWNDMQRAGRGGQV
ncbi:hypothetical protein QSH46_022260, partial [Xanthomonas arboricola pv. juglandis]